MKNNKKAIIVVLLIVIVLFQVGLKLFVANEKAYLHIDEGYSYGLMNYDRVEFSENEDFYENWHNSEYYLDYLTISSDKLFDLSPVYTNQKNDVHPPLFYFLLRVAASFTPDEFTKWTGIILNLMIFVCSSILVYLLSKKIFKSRVYALLICLASGFSIASIESTIFVRMYELATLNILIISYLHIKNYNKDNLDIKSLALLGLAAFIGSLTHYYYIIFLGVLYLMYIIRYIFKKNWKNAIKYTITMVIAAMFSLAVFPYSISHMFFGYRGQGVLESFSDSAQLLTNFARYIYVLHSEAFNYALLIFVLTMIITIFVTIIKNKKIIISVSNKAMLLISVPTLLYFVLVAIASPFQEIRYILPVVPLIVILVLYCTKVILQELFSKKVTLILIAILVGLMLILPLGKTFKMEYLYKNLTGFVQKVDNGYKELPTIYVFDINHNRFMDDIYIFSKINNSYIMNSDNFSRENINKILDKKDVSNGIIVFINEGQNNDDILEEIKVAKEFDEVNWIERLNSCDVYLLK